MISDRQQSLLQAIIRDYTATAKPVSSGQLADRAGSDVSPATVRNDMAALEEAGYLQQPYTSAGRIPTEKAWRWYVQQLEQPSHVARRDQAKLQSAAEAPRQSDQELLRQVAKSLAEVADETIIVAFGKSDTYYTGLSHLFQHPEFENVDVLQDLSRVIDHLDSVMARLSSRVHDDVQVLVGRENPISSQCAAILIRYTLPRRHPVNESTGHRTGIIGILGPLRQDYPEHMALLRYTQELLQSV